MFIGVCAFVVVSIGGMAGCSELRKRKERKLGKNQDDGTKYENVKLNEDDTADWGDQDDDDDHYPEFDMDDHDPYHDNEDDMDDDYL